MERVLFKSAKLINLYLSVFHFMPLIDTSQLDLPSMPPKGLLILYLYDNNHKIVKAIKLF